MDQETSGSTALGNSQKSSTEPFRVLESSEIETHRALTKSPDRFHETVDSAQAPSTPGAKMSNTAINK